MNLFMIGYIVVSVLIIVLVLAQKSRDNGFSTMTGAKPSDGREVGKTFDKKLQVWTTWLVVLYVILSIVFTFWQLKDSNSASSLKDDVYQEELDEVEETEDSELIVEQED
ncbi:MAG: preprotein translocase subunit SecG [Clostridia bacterium]|nr:preprotein translocase subunit SecG [Clostridia bacterium]